MATPLPNVMSCVCIDQGNWQAPKATSLATHAVADSLLRDSFPWDAELGTRLFQIFRETWDAVN